MLRVLSPTQTPWWLLSCLAAVVTIGCSEAKPLREEQPRIALDKVILDLDGKGPNEGLIGWRFDAGEPREVRMIRTTYEPEVAYVTVHITTQEAPEAHREREPQRMAGQVRIRYRWSQEGWTLDRLENVSFEKQ